MNRNILKHSSVVIAALLAVAPIATQVPSVFADNTTTASTTNNTDSDSNATTTGTEASDVTTINKFVSHFSTDTANITTQQAAAMGLNETFLDRSGALGVTNGQDGLVDQGGKLSGMSKRFYSGDTQNGSSDGITNDNDDAANVWKIADKYSKKVTVEFNNDSANTYEVTNANLSKMTNTVNGILAIGGDVVEKIAIYPNDNPSETVNTITLKLHVSGARDNASGRLEQIYNQADGSINRLNVSDKVKSAAHNAAKAVYEQSLNDVKKARTVDDITGIENTLQSNLDSIGSQAQVADTTPSNTIPSAPSISIPTTPAETSSQATSIAKRGVVTITKSGSAQVYNKDGNAINGTFLANGTDWKTSRLVTLADGRQLYKVAANEYVLASDVSFSSDQTVKTNKEKGVFTANNNGTNAAVYNLVNGKFTIVPERVLLSNTQWRYDKKAVVGNTTYYKVSPTEWTSTAYGHATAE